jgi:hypothetical protein
VSGIVGAGGNVRAVCFGLGFRQLETKTAFILMGSLIIFSGITCAMVFIKGHAGLVTGHDSEEVIAAWKKLGANDTTLSVPEKDAEAAKDIDTDSDKNSEAEFNQFMEYDQRRTSRLRSNNLTLSSTPLRVFGEGNRLGKVWSLLPAAPLSKSLVRGGSAVVSLKLPLGHVSVLEVFNNFVHVFFNRSSLMCSLTFSCQSTLHLI